MASEVVIKGWSEQAFAEALSFPRPLLVQILTKFCLVLDDAQQQLDMARNPIDYKKIEQLAHKVKGSAGQVQCLALSECSASLEVAAKAHDAEKVDSLWHVWAVQAAVDRKAITTYLTEKGLSTLA